MGTLKQASTVIALEGRYRRKFGLPPMTPEDEKDARSRIPAADLTTVRKSFGKVKALLQFDRSTSPATAEQLAVLDPNVDPHEFADACGVPRRLVYNSNGKGSGTITMGLRLADDGNIAKPGVRDFGSESSD